MISLIKILILFISISFSGVYGGDCWDDVSDVDDCLQKADQSDARAQSNLDFDNTQSDVVRFFTESKRVLIDDVSATVSEVLSPANDTQSNLDFDNTESNVVGFFTEFIRVLTDPGPFKSYLLFVSLISLLFSFFYKQDVIKRHQIFLGDFCRVFVALNKYFHCYYAKVMIATLKEVDELQQFDNPSLSELLPIQFQPFYDLEKNPESLFTFNTKSESKINGLTNQKLVKDNINDVKDVYSEEIFNYLLEHKHLFSRILDSSESFNIFCYIFACALSEQDGHFDKAELQAISEFFHITNDDIVLASQIIEMNSTVPVSNILAKLVLKKYGNNTGSLEQIINNLFYIAEAGGTISQEEIKYIGNLSKKLKISKSVFEEIYQNQRQIKDDIVTTDSISVGEFIDDLNNEFSSENNIIISGRMHVNTLQKVFEECFGFKLRVYKSLSAKGYLADSKQTLGSLSHKKIESIQISGNNTVEEVENLFRDKLGLGVQLASIDNSRLLTNKKKLDECS